MNFQLVKPVYAEVCNTLFNPNCTSNPDPITTTQNLVQTFFNWFIIIAVIFFVYHFINGGIRIITSQGDAKKLEEGRNSLTNAVLGVVVVFSIFAILKLLGLAFGLDNLANLQISLPSLTL